MLYPCCKHCSIGGRPLDRPSGHSTPCVSCEQIARDQYVAAADANPERVGNGCMIYGVNA